MASIAGKPVLYSEVTSALKSELRPGATFDPPTFRRCAAYTAKAYVAQKQLPPLNNELIAQCRQQYEQAIPAVMKSVIEGRWHTQAAQAAGFTISSAEAVTMIRRQANGMPLSEFAAQSGMPLAMLEQQTRNQMITRRLRAQAAAAKSVSPASVAAYYQAHKSAYLQPETRDIDLVLTTTKARAQSAERALQSGQSAASVSARLAGSSELQSAAVRLSHLTQFVDQAIWQAASRARPGQVVGPAQTAGAMYGEPIEGGRGVQEKTAWFTLRLKTVHGSRRQSLGEVSQSIRAQLQREVRTTVESHYQANFRKHWIALTHCANGFVFPGICANAGAEANAAALSEPEAEGEPGGEEG